MAYDTSDTQYHLTPEGWKLGKYTYDGQLEPTKDTPEPAGRVLTLNKHIRQQSAWADEDIDWSELWRSPTITDEDLKNLQKIFPRPR